MDAALAGSPDGGQNYAHLLHGFLISDNDKRDLVPGIASAWALSPNGLTWTFTIRTGVKFHDGTALTAEDVLWSLQHAIGPDAVAWNASSNQITALSRNMSKIELVGADKVAVTTKTPEAGLATFLSEASTVWVPILPRRATLHDTAQEAAYDQRPIGAGPMKLVSRVPGSSIKFERFDDYYYQPKNGFSDDRRTAFRTLEVRVVPELATRIAALRGGQADIVAASVTLEGQVTAGGARLVFAKESQSLTGILQGCWDTKYPCSDKRVRQALSYAIDKGQIQSKLAGGPRAFEIKGWGFVTPSTIGYTSALDPLPHDPNKARQLLADAGYPGGKGFGTLIINTYTTSEVPFQVESAQLVADFWKKELSLQVEVRTGDAVRIDTQQKSGELNGQLTWRPLNPRLDAETGVFNYWGNPSGAQILHKDAEIFGTVRTTFGMVDPATRTEAVRKLYARLAPEGEWIAVGHLNTAWGVASRVANWQPYALTGYPSALYTLRLK